MAGTSVGRNDPCPCGSGKKYKKCHGQSATIEWPLRPDVARANELKALDMNLADRLLAFARKRHGPHWLNEAFADYLGSEGFELPQTDLPLAVQWALFSRWTGEAHGLTLAQQWHVSQTKTLDPDTLLLLDAYERSWLSIWEIESVERGVGTKLVDQLTREERFVLDVASSKTLQPLDMLLGFVLDCDDVSFFGGVHALPFAPREAASVVAEARKICRVRTRPVAKSKLRDIDVQLDIVDLWRGSQEAFLSRPMPTLTNTDGDPFAITTDEYELVATRDRIVTALESIEGVQEAEHVGKDLEFVVTKPGNGRQEAWNNTVIGRVLLTSSGRLRVETNSIRPADANTSTDRTNSERELPPPEILAKMREYREQHMTRWLDDSIPALGGMTPREAMGHPKQRKALEVLLKSFEHSEARLPEEERIDIARLRRALGLR